MIELQKFEVAKMVKANAIKSAYTVSRDGKHHLTFSVSDLARGKAEDQVLMLVTQKGHIKEFKTLDAVRAFIKDVGMLSFHVCG